ncbi:MAG: hypothetical protein MJ165_00770 [Alphaproteobacteria bacterium]|nr:hypothetical protein [Alphaproteobacteria bacterium]
MYRPTNVQISVQKCPDGISDKDCERNRYIARETGLYQMNGGLIIYTKPYFKNRSAYDWGNAKMAKICAECQLRNGKGQR